MADLASRRWFLRPVVVVIAVSTLMLTAAFIGILAHLDTSVSVTGLLGRVPYYLVVAALIFVGSIVLFEENASDGSTIIVSALVVSLLGFTLIGLAAEGVRVTILYPRQVFVSQLVPYLFAASLISTGLGYWALNHWREFSAEQTEPEP